MINFRPSPLLSTARFLGAAIIGAYIVLNALNILLFRLTEGLGQAGASAITVPPMVVAMLYVVVPLARKLS
ncbi:antibiotic biosynthesis monooxygenase (ABM) superfamily enzyme [Rhizobium sp. BK619]|jgi:hypothetical protein|uniref:MFS transporter n=1 Tax=Rhizobium leguminosarum bv. trifolii WSM597 TaxID=754764 RepID=I9N0S0_RHILT|nr:MULTISPECIES: hypothetical protein [Rhizobium]EJB01454.1 hypothetical protein Rleg9DRAFT_0186 [Rhizobium leguminosarum bv. trifolii WSM597]MBB3644158.1 antibiotic biosynthesis monooxygenase (ABM) superfamily enzyme [Rhizobium sp. BK619]